MGSGGGVYGQIGAAGVAAGAFLGVHLQMPTLKDKSPAAERALGVHGVTWCDGRAVRNSGRCTVTSPSEATD